MRHEARGTRAQPLHSGAASTWDCYAVVQPGLESLVGGELRALGITPDPDELGGVPFSGTTEQLYTANLELRVASRVLVRVAAFDARTFFELERRSKRIEWDRFVPSSGGVHFRVTSKKSKLYHASAVAERLAASVTARQSGVRLVEHSSEADAADDGVQRFVVRVFRDHLTISADSSGALLHRRGYRGPSGKAPLRETLGAAMLLASGWRPDQPLVDPMCGSGTIPIEAALLARRIPPGRGRRFGFERWPDFEKATWRRVGEQAEERVLPTAPAPIVGRDRDAGAIGAACDNAERAGVARDITFEPATISALTPPPGTGWVITNPPYGARLGDRRALRDLYARLGQVLRDRFPGWQVALLSADRALAQQVGLDWVERLETLNGGIRVRLLLGALPPAA